MKENYECENCKDDKYVCEDHDDTPWRDGDGCCGGAGMVCPKCNAGQLALTVNFNHSGHTIEIEI